MPKVGKGRPPSNKPKIKVAEITCLSCGLTKKISEFYVSSSVYNAGTGRVQYCKECCNKLSVDEKGIIDVIKFKDLLEKIDKPFLKDVLQSAYEESKKEGASPPIGLYFKNINSLGQYKNLTWKDSKMLPEIKHELNYNSANEIVENNSNFIRFTVTDDILNKWGFGYSNDEYGYFEKKWNQLIDNYGEKTSFHIEGLKTYIRFRVKEEIATARGDVKEAKEWGALAKDAATAAKINVSQLSKSDISGGVELIPQLFEAVESEVGIISILPYLKEQPYDDADLIIWCIINYGRRLEDKSRVEYKEIWQFYDQMLEEYYKQKGFSENKIKEEKIKRNNIFRDLGEIYREPLYEESDL
jgi:hypothetical protein